MTPSTKQTVAFPVLLNEQEKRECPDCPRAVPWSLLSPHEEWAQRNHSQTLLRLAERGGLDPREMIAIIEHRKYQTMPLRVAVDHLKTLL